METKKLLLDENRGIYIPQKFYENFSFSDWNIKQADYADLADPENETYWDTWQDLLDNAYHYEGDVKWVLQQDGDLWAVSEYDGLEEVTDVDLLSIFDEFIDETTPRITILGCQYVPSTILRDTDPTAYRCHFNDWLDGEIRSGTYIEYNDTYFKA